MTFPCPSSRQVNVTSTCSTEPLLARNLKGNEPEIDSVSDHDDKSRDVLASSPDCCVTKSLKTVGHDECGDNDTVRCQSDLLTLSTNLVRLKQSLSACEGVNFYATGSDVDLDPDQVKVGPSFPEEVFLSAPETPVVRTSKEKSPTGMTKFQKFFEPLRRSRSTGNTKDSKEEHPLFFRSISRKEERLSADTGNGSMESELDHDSEDSSHLDQNKWKNLSSEMKERFSIFMRHHGGDLSGHFKDTGRRQKMTLETVSAWAKSFDNLLADKNGLHWFREFLKSEFSEENIEFWIACEEYKHMKSHKMSSQANKIFAQFVAYQAPREINIDSKTRDLTYENMKHPEVMTFEAAQKRIESLMGKDSYPRFIESDLYSHLLSGLKSS